MYKLFVLAALAACASAAPGFPAVAVSPAVGSSVQSVSRSYDGSSSVSQYSKAVDTAFSSVRKYDTRVTNDARYLADAVVAAPAVTTYAHAPVVAAPAVTTYSHAPVVAAPAVATYAHAAPVAHGLLGVAYSAAPAVSHLSFDGFGAHYVW
ncbi:larval/pupal cuticle protein H1C-like [Cimex lectularius]|uniref:CPF family cuticle protein n=1 Tax=Cimex lectularius TaxID=79782 RepID=A0A8I6RAC0_CIMLE|nr:larval/pupal cuticle protein H1C-like [Cimex lectularius]